MILKSFHEITNNLSFFVEEKAIQLFFQFKMWLYFWHRIVRILYSGYTLLDSIYDLKIMLPPILWVVFSIAY